jgi:hypothetical protein
MSIRPILPLADIAVDKPADAKDRGPSPQLQWIKIADLVVDEAYQRPISNKGATNIRAIARNFRWASFSPVVVSPIDGGKFAIVDGQHRTTAAALCGIEAVPCQIILATADGQAEAFAQINGATTRVHSMSLFRAAVAAGDPKATIVQSAADRAGVVILPYPKQISEQKPNETMAVGAISQCVRLYGVDVTATALKALTRPANAARGTLVAPIIKAVAETVYTLRNVKTAAQIFEAIDGIQLQKQLQRAMSEARITGSTITDYLARQVLKLAGASAVAASPQPAAAAKPAPASPPPAPPAPIVRPPAVPQSRHDKLVAMAKAAVPYTIDKRR